MKFFSNFNKNTGALAVLLCSFFFNPGEGKAQVAVWKHIDHLKDTIIITVEQPGGVCGQPEGMIHSTNPNIPIFLTSPTSIYDYTWTPMATRVNQSDPSKRFVAKAGVPFDVTFEFRGYNQGGYFLQIDPSNNSSWFMGKASITEPRSKSIKNDNFSGWSGSMRVKKAEYNNVVFDKSATIGYLIFQGGSAVGILENNNFGMSGSLHQYIIPFSITGIVDAEVPVLGTTVQPQIPYMVLHAPPGDGSSSEFQETKTTCREFVNTYAEEGSTSANVDVKLGVAGSLGFIATVDFEFSVTFSAAVGGGSLAVTTKSNQTCVTTSAGFSTNQLLSGGGSGDVFIGYGTDLKYGIYKTIKIDPNTCAAIEDPSLIYSPTGTPRKFVYTEEAIQADIIYQKGLAANPAFSVRARNEAQNQADVWEKVLAQNNANKNNPKNALIEPISFSAGANSRQESSITVLETTSLDVEHFIDFSTGVSAVVEVGGSGVSGGFEYRGAYRYGKTSSTSAEVAKVVRYTLADDDAGDKFDVKVVRDPMFGTPVFRVEPTSKSSCPYQGGYQRDQPRLKHDGTTKDRITSQGNPVGSSATFKVDICNESNEARTYNLKLNAQSNLNGAVVSAAGVPLNGNDLGQSFSVPANGCVQDLIVEVKRLSASSPLAYPDLELFLYAPCEEDIQTSVFASVFFGNTTSVNDLADNSLLSVSPNPTSGWLQISLPTGNNLEYVRVMDLAGKTVRNLKLGAAASNTQIDLSGLSKGIYTLQARAEGQVFVKKVIVE